MTDTVDPATRSRMMAAIPSRNTGPEMAMRHLLWSAGVKGYRLHRSDIEGKPDLAWVGKRVAVFVDGAFWHGHPDFFSPGKSGPYWDAKIERNRRRDAHVNSSLLADGWTVVRVWDFEIEKQPTEVLSLIVEALSANSSIASGERSINTLKASISPGVAK